MDGDQDLRSLCGAESSRPASCSLQISCCLPVCSALKDPLIYLMCSPQTAHQRTLAASAAPASSDGADSTNVTDGATLCYIKQPRLCGASLTAQASGHAMAPTAAIAQASSTMPGAFHSISVSMTSTRCEEMDPLSHSNDARGSPSCKTLCGRKVGRSTNLSSYGDVSEVRRLPRGRMHAPHRRNAAAGTRLLGTASSTVATPACISLRPTTGKRPPVGLPATRA